MMALIWQLTGSLAGQPDFILPGKEVARMADW